jgi:hypothetical protein
VNVYFSLIANKLISNHQYIYLCGAIAGTQIHLWMSNLYLSVTNWCTQRVDVQREAPGFIIYPCAVIAGQPLYISVDIFFIMIIFLFV